MAIYTLKTTCKIVNIFFDLRFIVYTRVGFNTRVAQVFDFINNCQFDFLKYFKIRELSVAYWFFDS